MPSETREPLEGERGLSPLDHAAIALYEELVKHAIKLIEQKQINYQLVRSVAENIKRESDRSCAIILGSLMDEVIQDLILEECNATVSRLRARMFDPQSGMLPNMARRIFFAVALEWITQGTFHNLNIARKIRNEFAHNIACENFNHAKIRGLLASISPCHKKQFEAMVRAAITTASQTDKSIDESKTENVIAEYDKRGRFFFIAECGCILHDVVTEMCVFPEAQRKGINPRDIVSRGFDRMPDNLRRMSRSTARLILETVNATFQLRIDLTAPD
jgi:hypothetical protein